MATIELENVKVLPGMFRNFSGSPTPYNKRGGDRFFNIGFNDPTQIDILKNMGVNVKYTKPREDKPDYQQEAFVRVKVGFHEDPNESFKDPKIYVIPEGTNDKMLMTADTVGDLDNLGIIFADIVLNTSTWDVNGNSGTTLYLRLANFVIRRNRFESKNYSSVTSSNYSEAKAPHIDYDTDALPFE